jgi:hypothetical protein
VGGEGRGARGAQSAGAEEECWGLPKPTSSLGPLPPNVHAPCLKLLTVPLPNFTPPPTSRPHPQKTVKWYYVLVSLLVAPLLALPNSYGCGLTDWDSAWRRQALTADRFDRFGCRV